MNKPEASLSPSMDSALHLAAEKGFVFYLKETNSAVSNIQSRRGEILPAVGFEWVDHLERGGFGIFAGVVEDVGIKRVISAQQRAVFLKRGAVRIWPRIYYDLSLPKVVEFVLPIEFMNTAGELEMMLELRKFGHQRRLAVTDGSSVMTYTDKYHLPINPFIEQVLWQVGLTYKDVDRLSEQKIEGLIRAISRGELARQALFFRQRLDLVRAALSY